MSNYIYTNGRLYNANELKHWKYVNKKKVNGKWRYWYDDNSREDMMSALKIGGKTVIKVDSKTHQALQDKAYDQQYKDYNLATKIAKKNTDTKERLLTLSDLTRKKAANRVMKALNKIGKGKVDDKLKEASTKVKNWVSNLFKKK